MERREASRKKQVTGWLARSVAQGRQLPSPASSSLDIFSSVAAAWLSGTRAYSTPAGPLDHQLCSGDLQSHLRTATVLCFTEITCKFLGSELTCLCSMYCPGRWSTALRCRYSQGEQGVLCTCPHDHSGQTCLRDQGTKSRCYEKGWDWGLHWSCSPPTPGRHGPCQGQALSCLLRVVPVLRSWALRFFLFPPQGSWWKWVGGTAWALPIPDRKGRGLTSQHPSKT